MVEKIQTLLVLLGIIGVLAVVAEASQVSLSHPARHCGTSDRPVSGSPGGETRSEACLSHLPAGAALFRRLEFPL
jgi:hypothetical protein